MIRLTWRQFRAPAVSAAGALVLVAIVLALTGPHLVHLYDTTVAHCGSPDDCAAARSAFVRHDSGLRTWLDIAVAVTPGVIGLFWGAPLVTRELEAGTFRLAWTQSVTRTRWLAVKLGVLGLASAAAAGLLSLMVTWWAGPLDRAGLDPFGTFDQRGVVPLGYAAFAFTLGVTAGILIRRTLPAMVTAAVAFLVVRVAATSWVRPHLVAPLHRDFALDPTSTGFGSSVSGLSGLFSVFGGPPQSALQPARPDLPSAWIYSTRIVDRTGRALTNQTVSQDCPGVGQGGGPGPSGGPARGPAPADATRTLHDCVAKVGATYHELVTYQPASRYWTFQWCELAVFVGATVILAGLGQWAIRHRT